MKNSEHKKDEEFADLCVEQLFEVSPVVEKHVKPDELKRDIHAVLKEQTPIQKHHNRMNGPLHFAMNFIRSATKYAMIASVLSSPFIHEIEEFDGDDGEPFAPTDMIAQMRKIPSKEEEDEEKEREDNKNPYVPTPKDIEYIAVLDKACLIIERWFQDNKYDLKNFKDDTVLAVNAARTSRTLDRDLFAEMCEARFLGKLGKEHILDKLGEIKIKYENVYAHKSHIKKVKTTSNLPKSAGSPAQELFK